MLICGRHNLVIQLTNSLVDPRAENAQVHPKIIDRGVDRGKYPIQFLIPMRIGDLDRLDGTPPCLPFLLSSLAPSFPALISTHPVQYHRINRLTPSLLLALTIDRILDAYSLPLNPGGLGFTGRLDHLRTGILSVGGPSDRISMSGPGDQIRARLRAQERGLGLGSSRDARLQALLEFLGVNLSWRDREPYGVRPYGLLGRNS
jgi:hypothetical protein